MTVNVARASVFQTLGKIPNRQPQTAKSDSALRNKRQRGAFVTDNETHRANMHILWLIIIGFVAGVIAKLLHPGSNEPAGFILTTLLGIAGAFVATYLGQAIGWYQAGQGAGLIGAVVGAVVVLVIWGLLAPRRA